MPPLSISISSTIGIKVGSFGNSLTVGRKISREHMTSQEEFLFMAMDTNFIDTKNQDNQKEKSY
jgi:hypothetical protein